MSDSRLRIGVLAGEASGDLLGARLLIELRKAHPELIVEGIGGPLMEAQGLSSLFPMDRLSVIGLVEPLKRLPELLQHSRRCSMSIFVDSPPDLFLGIDSPDFNLHLEQKAQAYWHTYRASGEPNCLGLASVEDQENQASRRSDALPVSFRDTCLRPASGAC